MKKLKEQKIHSLGLVILLFAFSLHGFAEDANQYIPDTLENSDQLNKVISKEGVGGSAFVGESPNAVIQETELNSPYINEQAIQDIDDTPTPLQKATSVNVEGAGIHDFDTKVITYKNENIAKEVSGIGRQQFGISFIKDDFDYTNDNNSFQRTFRGDAGDPAWTVRFSGHRYLYKRGTFALGMGAAAGVGYNGGTGHFINNEPSSEKIHLWTFPVEMSFLMEVPLSSFFSLGISGGPSLLGILQHRSDLEDGNAKKRVRQWGYGVFGGANIKVNLGRAFPSTVVNFLSSYSISRYFLSFETRYQNYGNFKDEDVSISGLSYGFGFVFEYL